MPGVVDCPFMRPQEAVNVALGVDVRALAVVAADLRDLLDDGHDAFLPLGL
jgi:hypothetical protein